MATIGSKLLDLINQRQLSIAKAAAMIGMSRQLLWRMCHDDVPNPGILTVQKIVLALGGRMRDLWDEGPLVKAESNGDEEGST
jgi:transcriptional regulator with XRE-family HTH domain